MQPQTFVFFGIVGSGKGTQAKLLENLLKEKYKREVVYVGTGSEFRKLMESGSYTGELLKGKMNAGVLITGALATSSVMGVLEKELKSNNDIILDGYPRTVEQSKSFAEIMQFFERENIKIIYIELSEGEAMKRNLLRGRHDDTEEGLAKRFDEYKNNVIPAMNYFKGKSGYTIYTINGEQTVENVHKDIIKTLEF